ncbi:hypothetical protein HLB44_00525 [Aquincola sp. S2]|uniref:Uncharacterized protein n=1 Tax=Pseudaquabacterium terrae TaxID=2732868 RepID=A0ABX2EC60_9BURK|nr:hypothetical protein [Aquabacterium terrae]NRF65458.1 hypothetical protein [Aquabacterium terrae]
MRRRVLMIVAAATPWATLGSPRAAAEAASDASSDGLRRALVAATARHRRFEVWVSHQFVLSALAGGSTASGEGLSLEAASDGTPRILGRLAIE